MHLHGIAKPAETLQTDAPVRALLTMHPHAYADLDIQYALDDAPPDVSGLTRFLCDAFASEANLFYALAMVSLRRDRSWERVEELVNSLISLHARKGLLGAGARLLLASRALRGALIDVAQHRLHIHEMEELAERLYRDEYHHRTAPTILEPLVSYDRELTTLPIDKMQDVLALFDRQRAERLALAHLVLSSLAGGAAGSLVAYLLR